VTSTELWLVRHGQTAWSADGRHTGRSDVPLTAEGEEQARAVRARLPAEAFDLVLASPLQRARRTAELAGLPGVEIEPAAQEWDYGAYEGLTRAQIQGQVPGWSPWTHPKMPGGETLDQVAARADAVVARVRAAEGREGHLRACLVAHAHFLRVLATRWVGVDVGLARHLLLDPGGVGLLGDDRGTCAIARWNA